MISNNKSQFNFISHPKSKIAMNTLVTAISTGTMAFSATNIDDLVILTLFVQKNGLLTDDT